MLAENGSELSAVRALKCGAKDYLPLARITRESLLGVIRSLRQARAAAQAAAMLAPGRATRPHSRCRAIPS
jgi:DNA-binding response OmpR family regulator